MGRTHAQRLAARDGYFGPDSMVRLLGNSPVTPFLGGGAAVLLQVAHPLVACGVTQHSGFDRNLWRRLNGTLRALYLIAFGDKREAEQAGAAVQALHRRVQGKTTERLGPFPPGTLYSASDPELMLWVHATLVESSLAAFEQFVRPLSADERERYVGEMNLVARLFGTPTDVLPRSHQDFRAYFDRQLAGDAITVTAPARRVASVILAASLPVPLRLLAPAHRLATAYILPPRLRHEYRLRWTHSTNWRSRSPAVPSATARLPCSAWPRISRRRERSPHDRSDLSARCRSGRTSGTTEELHSMLVRTVQPTLLRRLV
jgi:uncharacterized protein (DUF2236 family)